MLRWLCFDLWRSIFILCLLSPQPASSYGDPVCCCSQGLHHPGQARMVRRKFPGGYRADPGQDTFRKQQAHLLPRKVSIFWGGKGGKKICWKPIMGRNEKSHFAAGLGTRGFSVPISADVQNNLGVFIATTQKTYLVSCFPLSYLFHYICQDRIIYLCITDDVSTWEKAVVGPWVKFALSKGGCWRGAYALLYPWVGGGCAETIGCCILSL